MKESKILKCIAYLLLFLLPLFILGNVAYMIFLSENEESLQAESIYETDYIKDLYFSNLYYFERDMSDLADIESLANGYIKYVSYQNRNQLLDCVVINRTYDEIYTNIDTEDSFYEEENLKEIFQSNEEKYVVIENGSILSNIASIKDVSQYPSYISTLFGSNFRQNLESYGMEERKDLDTRLEASEGENIGNKEQEELDIVIYSKIREGKSVSFYLLTLFLKLTKFLGRSPVVITPILLLVFLFTLIYVIMAAGHKKDKTEIYLNSLDEIPFDLLTLIVFLLGMFLVCFMHNILQTSLANITLFYTILMVMIMASILFYALGMIWFISGVKRLKAKTFISNNIITICAKKAWQCLSWIGKKCYQIWKRFWNGIKEFHSNLWHYFSLNIRALVYLFGFTFLTIFLGAVGIDSRGFQFLIFLLLLWGFTIYHVIKKVAKFKKIQASLKAIYEGNNSIHLEENEFSGELREMSHYINDISGGFLNAIEQGVKSEKMKAELITNVSHDIKTPLTSIINYVDLLKKEEIHNEKAKEYIEILDAKSQRLKRLTEDLVEASKASSGNLTLTITKLNLEELVNQSIGEFQEKFDGKGLEIVFQVKKEKAGKIDRLEQTGKIDHIDKLGKLANISRTENLCIQADSRYMYRIIENLFSNICKYALENSRVYIDLENKENQIYLTIKNISKERLNISEEELMQRFVRGDKARTTEGSGLGLSIAKSLTELQKGTFEIKIDGDLFKAELKFPLA